MLTMDGTGSQGPGREEQQVGLRVFRSLEGAWGKLEWYTWDTTHLEMSKELPDTEGPNGMMDSFSKQVLGLVCSDNTLSTPARGCNGGKAVCVGFGVRNPHFLFYFPINLELL